MKISTVLLLAIVGCGSIAGVARAEEPERSVAAAETTAVPFYAGSIVLPEGADERFTLSDNLTPIEMEGATGYIDSSRRFVGMSD
jgi:hypothetical protein